MSSIPQPPPPMNDLPKEIVNRKVSLYKALLDASLEPFMVLTDAEWETLRTLSIYKDIRKLINASL